MTDPTDGGLDRLLLFSDAVVAIAITLIALDLPVPEGATAHALRSSVAHNAAFYTAFLVSFIAIAGSWSQHHRVFQFVAGSDQRLRTLQFVWLFFIVLNPFLTKVLAEHGAQDSTARALRFSAYSLLQVLSNLALLAIVRHTRSARLLAKTADADAIVGRVGRRCLLPAGAFGLSIPFFFVTGYAWALWIAVPVLAGVWARVHHPR